MINLEVPKKFEQLVDQAHMVATEVFRKNSRKYDLAEPLPRHRQQQPDIAP